MIRVDLGVMVMKRVLYTSQISRSIWLQDETQAGTTTLGQSEPGSNGNEVSTPHISKTGALSSDAGKLLEVGGKLTLHFS